MNAIGDFKQNMGITNQIAHRKSIITEYPDFHTKGKEAIMVSEHCIQSNEFYL